MVFPLQLNRKIHLFVLSFVCLVYYCLQNRKPTMPSGLFVKQYFTSFHDDVISNPLTDEMRAMSSTR